MAVVVLIGNSHAIEAVSGRDGSMQFRSAAGDRITEFRFPDDATLSEVVTSVVSGLRHHMAGGATPEWIFSGNTQVDHEIGRRFGFDPEKEPARFQRPMGWGRKVMSPAIEAATAVMAVQASLLLLLLVSLHIKTTAGIDLICRMLGDPNSSGSGLYAPAVYMAVTSDGSPSSISDTALLGEIEDPESTLSRAQAAYAHTNGTSSYTLTKTFVSDRTISLQRYGIFNAPAGGTLAFVGDIDPQADLDSGDPITITHTVTL